MAAEGKLLSMSVWEDEASVERWRNLTAHRIGQNHGRMNGFSDYAITVVTPKRTYSIDQRDGAPEDSNRFLEV